ncbi:hypothetical protein JIQ42_06194 [Leishmania sp. Namibia]|uniref:hypothetical protein n=1 Tax=Leishmania sp. Namibia TaxID=2802991 RepID=UPI001B5D6452|nr:hypothetical protein JIQ42_06194 [Leishmania sp. Namibia]
MYTEKDLSVANGFASSAFLLSSAQRRSCDAPPLPLQCFLAPEPCSVGQEARPDILLVRVGEVAGKLLALLQATEYDTYRVQSIATEAMANLQMVRLHLIERTLNATVEREEARPSQEDI